MGFFAGKTASKEVESNKIVLIPDGTKLNCAIAEVLPKGNLRVICCHTS